MTRRLAHLGLGLLLCCSVACGDDDGGQTNNDNLNNNNTEPVCGNAVLETGEQCDDGSQNSDTAPNACRTTCRTAYCGDGVIDQGEACDGSNLVGNTCPTFGFTKGALACSPDTCQFDTSGCSQCGNNLAEGDNDTQVHYEVCDGTDLRGEDCISIGQAQGVLACMPGTCTWDISGCVGAGPVCGNGVVEQGEDCDDGNSDTTDACPDGPEGTCLVARCGDGFVWAGHEACDDGNGQNGDLCPDGVDGTCQIATCGDGHVFVGVEVCDTGSDPLCYAGCQAGCGDGRIQAEFGEVCDDGPGVDNQHCYEGCTGFCGDGIVDPSKGEECDYGYMWFTPTCNFDCTTSVCGDGICNYLSEDQGSCPQDCGSCGDGTCTWGVEYNCLQDCQPNPCENWQTQCNGTCYDWPHYDGEVGPICCANGPLQHHGGTSTPNCGVCGVNCRSDETCNFGHCVVQD